MKLNNTLAIAICLLPAFTTYATIETLSREVMVQGSGNGTTIFFVKSIKDFNAVVGTHEKVLTCIYDSSITSLEMIQEVVCEIAQSIGISVTCMIVNTNDMPIIKQIYPFTSAATLISFIDGEKMQQMDIDLQPLSPEEVIQ
jgi:hypothetical protein